MEAEVINLRSIRIENDSKIAYQEERIRSLQSECDQKVQAYQAIEIKLLKSQEVIEEKLLLIKD